MDFPSQVRIIRAPVEAQPAPTPESGAPTSPFAGLSGLAVVFLLCLITATFMLCLVAGLDVASSGSMSRMSGRGWLAHWTIHMSVASALAAAAGLVAWLSRRNLKVGAALAGLLVLVPGYWMGMALASGRWISQQPWVPAVRFGPAVGAAVGLAVFVVLLERLPTRGERSRGSLALTLGCLGAAVVFAIADAKVMRALHPTFHVFAHSMATLFAFVFFARVLGPRLAGLTRPRAVSFAGIATGALALVFALVSLVRIPSHIKGELVMYSPLAGHAIRGLGFGGDTKVGQFFDDTGGGDLMAEVPLPRGLIKVGDDWNVMLVIVDTLRADALPPVRSPDTKYVEHADTPVLNEFISESFGFANAYSQAAATHHSVPALFRSLESFEDPSALGVPLPVYMNELGRPSFAVMNRFFVQPHTNQAHRAGNRLKDLTEDFDRIGVYDEREQDEVIPLVAQQLEATGGDPFFAWVHFYNMHDPGWDDGRHLTKKDGPWPKRYRRTLKWLDRQFAMLLDELEKAGVADKTIIIIASDHGEGLGEHGAMRHGKEVYDSVIRVPLIVHVPGVVGRVVDTPVSNIDIVPTIADLLGAPLNPAHRGLSLVPLMAGNIDEWEREIYSTNWDRRTAALVHGSDKIIYDGKAQLFLRFDLSEDPGELTNLYSEDGETDKDLKRRLLGLNPSLFAAEVKTDEKQREIEGRFAKVDPAKPKTELLTLLRMAALGPSAKMSDEAERIFKATPHERVRALIINAFAKSDKKRWGKLLGDHLDSLAKDPRAVDLAQEMADLGQGAIASKAVARQMRHWAKAGSVEQWRPWLRLIEGWKRKSFKDFKGALRAMLQRATTSDAPDAVTTMALLRSVGSFSRRSPDAGLAKLVSKFVDHSDGLVRVQAALALGTVGNQPDLPTLDRLRFEDDLRLRLAALDAAIQIAPEQAEERLLGHSEDGYMAWAVTKRLRKHGTEKSLPYLEKELKNRQKWVRQRAKEAIAAIEKRGGKGK